MTKYRRIPLNKLYQFLDIWLMENSCFTLIPDSVFSAAYLKPFICLNVFSCSLYVRGILNFLWTCFDVCPNIICTGNLQSGPHEVLQHETCFTIERRTCQKQHVLIHIFQLLFRPKLSVLTLFANVI